MKKQAISNLIIYYFSGTGNAFNVTKWISNIANERGIDTELINIADLNRAKLTSPPAGSLIGFASPTHGFNFPPLMLNFLLKFPRAKNNKVFIMNTRGGLKFGKVFLPGLSGITQIFSALILMIKGYKVIGMRPVDLPSNWISIHPGLKTEVVESIYERRKHQTEQFANKIFDGRCDFRALYDIIQDLLIAPISVLYYFFGRYFFAKSFIASRDCNNCNLCIKECPVSAIKLVDNRPYWAYSCESCMHCMNLCPQRAIETAHGFIIGFVFLVNSIILFQLYQFLGIEQFLITLLPKFIGEKIMFLFNSAILIGCLILGYRLMHYLLRFKIVERVIVYTSFTKYKFWRRYKHTKFKMNKNPV